MILLSSFGVVDWGIVVLYFVAVLALGAFAARGQEDQETYFLGGRSMPTWAVTLSIVATALSAATYIGVPQAAFRGDLSYYILNIGGILGVLVVAAFLLPPLYRAGTTTIYGVLGQRYGPGATLAASVAFLVGRLLASGARLFIAGIAFSLILFDKTDTKSIVFAIVVFGAIGTIYTCMGGIRAVIWTDTLQIVLVVGAALASIFFLLDKIPLSLGEIYAHLQDKEKLGVVTSGFKDGGYDFAAAFTVLTGFAMVFQNVGSYGCDQDLVQRMMTTESPWKASLSLVLSQLVALPVVALFMVIGLLLSIFYGHPEIMGAAAPAEALSDDRSVYPTFLVNHMPAGLAGLAMAGMFAAAMSSLDSAVNAMAASVVADVIDPLRERMGYPKRQVKGEVKASRIAVVSMGALLILFAIVAAIVQGRGGKRLIDFALGVMTFALSGLLGVFCAALFTKRGNTTSVIAALITGALTIVFLRTTKIAFPWWMVIASPLSFAVCCIGKSPELPEPKDAGASRPEVGPRTPSEVQPGIGGPSPAA